MLVENIHNLKGKGLICILFIGIIVCSLYWFEVKNQMLTVNEEKEQEPFIAQKSGEMSEELSFKAQENDKMPEEFYSFEGKWIVGEYIDGIIESTGVDTESEEYKESNTRYITKYKEKYEGYTLGIQEDSINYFGTASEWGYHYDDYSDLFFDFQQPTTLGIAAPFLCAHIQLKELDESFYIIIDSNGKAIFEVGNLFFEMNRVN